MDIRRARMSHLEAMQAVLEQLMNAQIEQRDLMWRESLNHPGYVAWVAELDTGLVGFVDLFVFPDVAHGCKIGLIMNLLWTKAIGVVGSASACSARLFAIASTRAHESCTSGQVLTTIERSGSIEKLGLPIEPFFSKLNCDSSFHSWNKASRQSRNRTGVYSRTLQGARRESDILRHSRGG